MKKAINKFLDLDAYVKVNGMLQKSDLTVREVMERYGIRRQRALKMLEDLVTSGKLVEKRVYNPAVARYCRAWRKT